MTGMTNSNDPSDDHKGPATIPTGRRRPKPDVLELDGRKLKPATLMMGHGYDPALSEGALKPPIFPTSTFVRSEEHTSELQSLMRISYAVFCLKKKKTKNQ